MTPSRRKLLNKLHHQWCFEAIGVPWEISSADPISSELRAQIGSVIDQYDAAFSRFRADSVVTQAAQTPGHYRYSTAVAGYSKELAELYARLYQLSSGSISPWVGTSLSQLGYDATYSFTQGTPISAPQWSEAGSWQGDYLETRAPILLDVGAAGKGQLVDIVFQALEDAGHDQLIVDASGDLRVCSDEPIQIALEHPFDARSAVGLLRLRSGALCASAGNRRIWGDGFSHILDATTGMPVKTVVATWAVAERAMLADAAASALFFSDVQHVEDELGCAGVAISSCGSMQYSAAMKDVMFR